MSITDAILEPLNEQQRAAATTAQGPLLILAGAGSGKTKALTHRIAYLMNQGVKPWQILAVTFTNKAAKEMKDRVARLIKATEEQNLELEPWREEFTGAKLPVMGTFHSICVRILRRDIEKLGRDKSFVIYDQDDQEKLMKQVLKELYIDPSELKPRPALGAISRFKSEALGPKEALEQAESDRMKKIAEAYARYNTELHRANALDFDDLILETVRLFHECPDVLDHYQETWRYLHVDEYQDTNHAQYLFITLLAQKYRNLCVIGDPDQSIYGFRGADIRNILEFEAEYKDAVHIKLEQNYRSTQPILTAADTVIAENPDRPEKTMWTDKKEGDKIIVHELSDERKEADEAIKAIREQQEAGTSLKEQVILYRTHAQSRLLEEACMRNGIPYRILGGVKFYGRREIKDMLAYLYVLLNPEDTISLLRIINVPSRKIGKQTLEYIQQYATGNNLSLWEALNQCEHISELNAGVQQRILKFVSLILKHKARTQTHPVSDVLDGIMHDIDIEHWLRDGTDEGEERWHNVLELLSVTKKYDQLNPLLSLMSFIEEVALVSETDKLGDGGNDAITLMTLHLCKGLEFDHVVITGCEEGIFPHANSLFDKAQLEEERRIMYVGMTRARQQLRLMCTRSRILWGDRQHNKPSRFLEDIPENISERRSDDVLSAFAWAAASAEEKVHGPVGDWDGFDQSQDTDSFSQEELTEGTRISHPTFGNGTVLSRRGDVVDISFDSGEKKTFALSIAPLKII